MPKLTWDECQLQDCPVCPHCGEKIEEWWECFSDEELEGHCGDIVISCIECGKDYTATVEVTRQFSSLPLTEDADTWSGDEEDDGGE